MAPDPKVFNKPHGSFCPTTRRAMAYFPLVRFSHLCLPRMGRQATDCVVLGEDVLCLSLAIQQIQRVTIITIWEEGVVKWMTNSLHLFYRKERPSHLLQLPWQQDQCTLLQRREKSTTFELHPVNTIRDNEGCASEWLTATQKSSQVLVAYKKPSGNSWPMVLGLPFLPKLWRYITATLLSCAFPKMVSHWAFPAKPRSRIV